MRPTPSVPPGYAEHAPPPGLAHRVECFWTRLLPEGAPSLTPTRVLPDNCVDVILTFDSPDGDASALGVGAMTRPLLLSGPQPRLSMGVRFRPGHARAALGLPGSELTDTIVPWSELTADAKAELERVASHPSDDARLGALAALMERRLARAGTPPAFVGEAVRRLETTAGRLRVATLADGLGVSRQHLARQLSVHVGLSPKTFARVVRMRAALARADAARAAHPHPPFTWSGLAYDLGFADQSHLIEEFRDIAGMTPTGWASR